MSIEEYRINSEWRRLVKLFKELEKGRPPLSLNDFCSGEPEYVSAMEIWIKFLAKEERYVFHRSMIDICFNECERSMELYNQYRNIDSKLIEPLVQSVFINYSKPFKPNYGIINKGMKLNIRFPDELASAHDEIMHDRDKIFAHNDYSPKNPRTSIFGISIKPIYRSLEEYDRLVKSIPKLISFTNSENIEIIKKEGMDSKEKYFSEFSMCGDLTESWPNILADKYPNE